MTAAPRLPTAVRWLALRVAATRPAFLTLTVVAVALGWSAALHAGAGPALPEAFSTLAAALLAHAGANVVNDYHDARNGSDAANVDRVAPFTGGSRFIQDGRLTEAQTLRLGLVLLVAVVPIGLWLVLRSGPGLLALGAAGLVLAWAYSAPPLALMSRGWGEVAVACAWWGVTVGAAWVPLRAPLATAVVVGASLALSMAAILVVNQFPDVRADMQAGKRNWVVRAGPRRARFAPMALALAAHSVVLVAILGGALPASCSLSFVALAPSIRAARQVMRHAAEPRALAPAIRATIVAAHLHGLVLAVGLLLG